MRRHLSVWPILPESAAEVVTESLMAWTDALVRPPSG